MPDPYRSIKAPDAPPPAAPAEAAGSTVRPVLWLLLVVSAAGNGVVSTSGDNVPVGVALGLVALACATALGVHHYRHRSR
jgi:hypothetical protein